MKITRTVKSLSGHRQHDLFGTIVVEKNSTVASTGSRTFICPDPHELLFGATSLKSHLQIMNIKDPFVIRDMVNQLNWEAFESRYSVSGRAPYAPQSMVGLILHGIMQGTSSLRELERFARMDLGCMWVSGGIFPDHSVIGRFIQLHSDSFEGGLFKSLTQQILKATGSNAESVAVDGTIIEAMCSRYELIKKEALEQRATQAREKADKRPSDQGLQNKAALLEEAVTQLNARIAVNQAAGRDAKNTKISPTEPSAVVQALKGGKGTGPSYKPSVVANEKRVVVAFGVSGSSETALVGSLLDQAAEVGGEVKELLSDGGYDCYSVIDETLERGISLLCAKECPQKKSTAVDSAAKKIAKSEFSYDEEKDIYRCPAQQELIKTHTIKTTEKRRGYVNYQCQVCEPCELKSRCTSNKRGRVVKRYDGEEKREALHQVMEQPKAQKRLRQRKAIVEPVFSSLKCRQGLTRFHRKGMKGVTTEFALHLLAYNMSRWVAILFTLQLLLCLFVARLRVSENSAKICGSVCSA